MANDDPGMCIWADVGNKTRRSVVLKKYSDGGKVFAIGGSSQVHHTTPPPVVVNLKTPTALALRATKKTYFYANNTGKVTPGKPLNGACAPDIFLRLLELVGFLLLTAFCLRMT